MIEVVFLCVLLVMVITALHNHGVSTVNGRKPEIFFWNCVGDACFERRKVVVTLRVKGGFLNGKVPGIGALVCGLLLLFAGVRADESDPKKGKWRDEIMELKDESKKHDHQHEYLSEAVNLQMSEIAKLWDQVKEMKGEPYSPKSEIFSIDDPPDEDGKRTWYRYFFPKERGTNLYNVNKTRGKEEETQSCETFKCCSLLVIETAMDIIWVAVTDPINLANKVSEGVGKIVKDQLQVFSGILGTMITFTTLNVVLYAVSKFRQVYSKARKLCGRMCDLPVPALGISLFKKMLGWVAEQKDKPSLEKMVEERLQTMAAAMEKIKEELKRPIVKKDQLLPKCGYCGSNSHIMRDCPLKRYDEQKCHYCGEKGHIMISCPKRKKDMSQGMKPWKKDPRVQMVIEEGEGSGEEQVVICSYCKKPNHTVSSCLEKRKDDMSRATQDLNPFRMNQFCRICGLNNHTESNCFRRLKKTVKTCSHCGGWNHNEKECYKKAYDEQQRKKSKEGNVSTVGMSSQVPQGEESESKDPKDGEFSNSRKTRVYAPINFEGKRFSKCLIDTGAQANLMPASDVTRHQFVINKGGVTEVRGFNGSPGKILGTVLGELQFGPDKGARKTEFLVSPDVGEPIIGFPTLRDFGLSINCQSHEIFNESTGEAVLCSIVSSKKN